MPFVGSPPCSDSHRTHQHPSNQHQLSLLHAGCLGIVWFGWSPVAAGAGIAFYFGRMFAVTGFYHRYFSHKTFQTSRFCRFLFAVWGSTAAQRGPLWWAYHHRHHHRHSDESPDGHSPHVHGVWRSHLGWITSRRNFPTDYRQVRDLARYPELVFLNRFDGLVPALFAVGMFGLRVFFEAHGNTVRNSHPVKSIHRK